jgi:hypothetical protein
MTRAAIGFDRFATLFVGVALIALGGAAVAWQRGVLAHGRVLWFTPALEASRTDWWPWASAGVGVTLVLVGLRWLASHRPARRASRVALRTPADSVPPVTADAGSVANAAAIAIRRDAAVLKAKGTATFERGVPTVTIAATVHARRGLGAGARAADDTAAEVAAMLGDGIAVRTVLRVDAKRRHGTVQ